jgi:hypothetical protein
MVKSAPAPIIDPNTLAPLLRSLLIHVGNEGPIETLAGILGHNGSKSSTLREKLSHLRKIRVIDSTHATFLITELGSAIANPRSKLDEQASLMHAFSHLEPFRQIIGLLGERRTVPLEDWTRYVHAVCDLSEDDEAGWAQYLLVAVTIAGLANIQGQKVVAVSQGQSRAEIQLRDEILRAASDVRPAEVKLPKQQNENEISLRVSLPSGGEILVSLPQNLSPADTAVFRTVLRMLEGMGTQNEK